MCNKESTQTQDAQVCVLTHNTGDWLADQVDNTTEMTAEVRCFASVLYLHLCLHLYMCICVIVGGCGVLDILCVV